MFIYVIDCYWFRLNCKLYDRFDVTFNSMNWRIKANNSKGWLNNFDKIIYLFECHQSNHNDDHYMFWNQNEICLWAPDQGAELAVVNIADCELIHR